MNVPVELSKILITEMGDHQVIFLKEAGGERSFPILIGIGEAMAIDRRLKGTPTPRPMTHELLANVIDVMGGQLEKIIINDIQDHTFIATLYIRRGNQVLEVDSRPSDAIALGVAFETPIFVAEHVLETVLAEPSTEDRVELLRKRLEMLREKIAEASSQLADENFLQHAPEKTIEQRRHQLGEMKTEFEAIEQVLNKLG